MNSTVKKRLASFICMLGAVIMVFSISRMIPYGLSGNAHEVKVWFAVAAVACIVGLPFGVAYYYFRAQERSANSLEVEAQTLAAHAEQQRHTPPDTHPPGSLPKK